MSNVSRGICDFAAAVCLAFFTLRGSVRSSELKIYVGGSEEKKHCFNFLHAVVRYIFSHSASTW